MRSKTLIPDPTAITVEQIVRLFDSLGDARPRAVRPLPSHAHRPCSPASLAASRFVLPDADFLSSFRRAEIVAAARGIPLAHTCFVSPASTV